MERTRKSLTVNLYTVALIQLKVTFVSLVNQPCKVAVLFKQSDLDQDGPSHTYFQVVEPLHLLYFFLLPAAQI